MVGYLLRPNICEQIAEDVHRLKLRWKSFCIYGIFRLYAKEAI